MVSNMRGIRLKEEIIHVKQILEAAGIEFVLEGDQAFIENPFVR